MEKYIEFGKQLGLEGEKLMDFVKDREDKEREREERMIERDMKRLEFERFHKEKEIELALIDKEIELEKTRKGEIVSAELNKAKLPKLPPFNDQFDRMDAYLKRFERFAQNASWDPNHWATHLCALLQGKALDVYSRLSSEDALSYDALKKALLERYQLTEEGFRVKFRSCKPDSGETPQQFVVRLEDYLKRWMELGSVPEDFANLKDLILREQFMNVSPKSLQIFLKEHKVKNLKEMTTLAQQYLEAHDMMDDFQNQSSRGQTIRQDNYFTSQKESTSHTNGRVCYNCRSADHFIKNCPIGKGNSQQVKAGALFYDQEGYNDSSAYNDRSSYSNIRGRERFNGRGNVYGREAFNSNLEYEHAFVSDKRCPENTKPKHEVCFISYRNLDGSIALNKEVEKINRDKMPVVTGLVGGIPIDVLRDTGCSCVIVKREFVDLHKLTGEYQQCTLVDGTVRCFPKAMIEIKSPFFTGQTEALCVENPVYPLIIGNIRGLTEDHTLRSIVKIDTGKEKNTVSESGFDEDLVNDKTLEKELLSTSNTIAEKENTGKSLPNVVKGAIKGIENKKILSEQQKDEKVNISKKLTLTGVRETDSDFGSGSDEINIVKIVKNETNYVGVVNTVGVSVIIDEMVEETASCDCDVMSNKESRDIYYESEKNLDSPSIDQSTTVNDVKIDPDILLRQKPVLDILVDELPDVLTDDPGNTISTEREEKLATTELVFSKPYTFPVKAVIKSENKIRLEILKDAGITARLLTRMFWIFLFVVLGRIVEHRKLKLLPDKIDGLRVCSHPFTKNQVRSSLGFICYQREFIQNCSPIATSLTVLAKKRFPNKISWTSQTERSFRTLIYFLITPPILILSDFQGPFILQTDVSEIGIGTVLLQSIVKIPISNVRRRLLSQERAYSLIEKECLAVVYVIQKFQVFLYGGQFVFKADHQPLVYLDKANARLMHCVLVWQGYRFRILAIKRSENDCADF